MAYFNRGDSIFIPFEDGQSVPDSQNKPRMYKSVAAFENSFPSHNFEMSGITVVEYAEKTDKAEQITELQQELEAARRSQLRYDACHIWESGDQLNSLAAEAEVLIKGKDLQALAQQKPALGEVNTAFP